MITRITESAKGVTFEQIDVQLSPVWICTCGQRNVNNPATCCACASSRKYTDQKDHPVNKHIPFHDPALAASITETGRAILEETRKKYAHTLGDHFLVDYNRIEPYQEAAIKMLTESPPCESFARPEHRSGFASIGLDNAKTPANVGSVIRAAHCYGVASIAISGERITGKHVEAATNTMNSHRHIPVYRGDLRDLIPFGAVPVAVDLVEGAESLVDFVHPRSAFYIFGAEDNTLGKRILDWCPRRVMVPTTGCMNLAAAVNVVLYDRMAKRARK